MTEAFCYLLSTSALLPRTYGRSWCPPWTPAYSVRPPTAPGAWYNHLGVRPGVLGVRLAGLSLVKFCLVGVGGLWLGPACGCALLRSLANVVGALLRCPLPLDLLSCRCLWSPPSFPWTFPGPKSSYKVSLSFNKLGCLSFLISLFVSPFFHVYVVASVLVGSVN